MKKIISILIISLLLFTAAPKAEIADAADANNVHEIEYITKDGYILKSTLTFPNKKLKTYPLVVLIHSWAQSSKFWGKLPDELLKNGYAILQIDLRGHGMSNYMTNMKQRSYIYLSKEAIQKIPNDVYQILAQVFSTYSNLSHKEIFFIGADIGASAAIYVANNLGIPPGAMILISPQVNFKGIYTPNMIVDLGNVPILAVAGRNDTYSTSQIKTLKKYAQGSFSFLSLPHGGPGMVCLTVNDGAASTLTTWLMQKTPSKQQTQSK